MLAIDYWNHEQNEKERTDRGSPLIFVLRAIRRGVSCSLVEHLFLVVLGYSRSSVQSDPSRLSNSSPISVSDNRKVTQRSDSKDGLWGLIVQVDDLRLMCLIPEVERKRVCCLSVSSRKSAEEGEWSGALRGPQSERRRKWEPVQCAISIQPRCTWRAAESRATQQVQVVCCAHSNRHSAEKCTQLFRVHLLAESSLSWVLEETRLFHSLHSGTPFLLLFSL